MEEAGLKVGRGKAASLKKEFEAEKKIPNKKKITFKICLYIYVVAAWNCE